MWMFVARAILSSTAHVDFLLSIATQRFYLLNQLKHMSLCISGLDSVFRALVWSRVTYALLAFFGNIALSDIDRINAMLRKARRWRLTDSDIDFELLKTLSDNALFSIRFCPSPVVFTNSCQQLHQINITTFAPHHCLITVFR